MKNDYFDFVDKHMDETKNKCTSMGVNFYDWVSILDNFRRFKKCYDDLKIVKSLIKNEDEHSKYLLKNILQNEYLFGKNTWINTLEKRLEKQRSIVFVFLKKVNDPYYFIFNPLWFYQTKVYERGYFPYQNEETGISDISMFVSMEWARHQIKTAQPELSGSN